MTSKPKRYDEVLRVVFSVAGVCMCVCVCVCACVSVFIFFLLLRAFFVVTRNRSPRDLTDLTIST